MRPGLAWASAHVDSTRAVVLDALSESRARVADTAGAARAAMRMRAVRVPALLEDLSAAMTSTAPSGESSEERHAGVDAPSSTSLPAIAVSTLQAADDDEEDIEHDELRQLRAR